MLFLDLAKSRRSVRAYTDKNIERKDLELCVEAARHAPSACNAQPWSFVIIDDPEKGTSSQGPPLTDRAI